MKAPKPCVECWVEAQRRTATSGDTAATYQTVLADCPAQHHTTPPSVAGDPFQDWKDQPA